MKKKNRDYFWIPFNITLLFGLMSGVIYEAFHTIPSSDWALNGQPLFERWINKQEWFLQGFIPGAIVGLIVGILFYRIKIKK